MTLRNKVMLIIVATVIVSLGGSGLFFLQSFEKEFRRSVNSTVDSIARNTAQNLADYLELKKVIAKHVGDMMPYEALELKDYSRVESYLADHTDGFDLFENGFFFLDAQGILRADYPPHPKKHGQSYASWSYFQRTMVEQRGIISYPYRSARNGEGVLTFTAYLVSPDGTPLGILGCSASLLESYALKKVRNQKIGKAGYLYVFDKSRQMILHPDDRRILVQDVPVGTNEMFDAAIEGFEGVAETVNSSGVAMLAAFHHVPGTDWIVVAQEPVAEALAALTEVRRPLILFIAFGSLLAGLIAALLVHHSMRDLLTLEKVTADLAIPKKGAQNIDRVLETETRKLEPLLGHAEFGPLASTIRQLYERLGLSLHNTQIMAGELDEAYEQLKATQSQILQQEKMASVGQLAAGVAHEINNPMGFITSNLTSLGRYQEKLLSYQKLLEDWFEQQADADLKEQMQTERKRLKIDYLLEDIQDLLAESTEGAERVREIVQNLKSFSRVDQAEFSETDINACLESTLAIAANEIKYKASVEKDFGELPLLPCYPQQLNQVFLNILVNSAQAIEEKGEIRVRTWSDDDSVKVAISDNGCGIPREALGRIFEPFFTTKDVGKGTGLGMSISYEIIQKHGGEIQVESQVGQGTTFTIELPLDQEENVNG